MIQTVTFKLKHINKKLFSSCDIIYDNKILEILKYLKIIYIPRINIEKKNIREKFKEKKETNFFSDDFNSKNYQKEMISLLRRFNNYNLNILAKALAIFILMVNENLGYSECNYIEINPNYQKKSFELYFELTKILKFYDFVFYFRGVFNFYIVNSKITRNNHPDEKDILKEILRNTKKIRLNFQQYDPYYKLSKDDTIFFLQNLIENNTRVQIINCRLNLNENLDYIINYCKRFPNTLEYFNYFENIDEEKSIILFDLNKESIAKIDDRFYHIEKINYYFETKFFNEAKHFYKKNNLMEKYYFQIDKVYLKDLDKFDIVEYTDISTSNDNFFNYFTHIPSNILYLNLEATLSLGDIEIVFFNVKEIKNLRYLKLRFRESFNMVDEIEDLKENAQIEEFKKNKNDNSTYNEYSKVNQISNKFQNFDENSIKKLSLPESPISKKNDKKSSIINNSEKNFKKSPLKKPNFFEKINMSSYIKNINSPDKKSKLSLFMLKKNFIKSGILDLNINDKITNENNNNILNENQFNKYNEGPISERIKNYDFSKLGLCIKNIKSSNINASSFSKNVFSIIDEKERTLKAEELKKNLCEKFAEKEYINFYIDNIIDFEVPNKFYLFDQIYEVMSFVMKNRNDKKFFDLRFDVVLLNEFCKYLENSNLCRLKEKIKMVSYIREWPVPGEKFIFLDKFHLPFEKLILLNIDFDNLLKGEKAQEKMSLHINHIMSNINNELNFIFRNLRKLDYFFVDEIQEKFFSFDCFPFDFINDKKVKIINISPKDKGNYFWDNKIKKMDYL